MLIITLNTNHPAISLYFEMVLLKPIGTKVKRGDGKTPEGLYFIEDKIKESSFFLALKVKIKVPLTFLTTHGTNRNKKYYLIPINSFIYSRHVLSFM